MTDFTKRYLKAIIGLGTGQAGDGTPGTKYNLTDHRMSAEISAWGGETQGQALVRIYGLSRDLMNRLTTIGPIVYQVRAQNSLQILAGDDPDTLSTIYNGTIQTAFADYNNAPDVFLEVFATSAAVAALKKPKSSDYIGTVSVDFIMRDLAAKAGLAFGENADVSIVIQSPTYNGSYLDQIKACAYANKIDFKIENFTLSIKNTFGHYSGAIPVISPSTGMVGYPTLNSQGMFVKSLFIPSLVLGGQIQVKDSELDAANGYWTVINVHHDLDSNTPNGKWFTTCRVFSSVVMQDVIK